MRAPVKSHVYRGHEKMNERKNSGSWDVGSGSRIILLTSHRLFIGQTRLQSVMTQTADCGHRLMHVFPLCVSE
jgi:hypothetical protein